MTLEQLAKRAGLATETVAAYTQAGLLPCKDPTQLFSDQDLYWLDMVDCFVENGSSADELKDLMAICEK
ncbi:MerR family transcriptional regulator [Secundilactobacillus muriivasis]